MPNPTVFLTGVMSSGLVDFWLAVRESLSLSVSLSSVSLIFPVLVCRSTWLKETSPCSSMASPGAEAEEFLVGVRSSRVSSLVSSQMVTMLPLRLLGVLFTPQDGESGLVGWGPLTTSSPSAASWSLAVDVLFVELLLPRFKVEFDFREFWFKLFGLEFEDVDGSGDVGFSAKGIEERWVFFAGFPG